MDYEQQKVIVWGICNKYDVLETMKSKRKETRFWNEEDNFVMEKSEFPSLPPPKHSKMPYLTLIRAQSFKWKAFEKVFKRSNSFWKTSNFQLRINACIFDNIKHSGSFSLFGLISNYPKRRFMLSFVFFEFGRKIIRPCVRRWIFLLFVDFPPM